MGWMGRVFRGMGGWDSFVFVYYLGICFFFFLSSRSRGGLNSMVLRLLFEFCKRLLCSTAKEVLSAHPTLQTPWFLQADARMHSQQDSA